MSILVLTLILILIYLYYNLVQTKMIHSYIVTPLTLHKKFPKVIYRTFFDFNVPRQMFEDCHHEWVKLNPNYNVIWFNNQDCDDFMLKYYSGSVFNAYKKLKPGAYKADLWRICLLYRMGGIYVDAFCTPFVSLETMLDKINTNFVSVLDPEYSGGGIHNGFIVSTPFHPFLRKNIDDIVKNVENNFYGQSPLEITGPICLRKSIISLTSKNPKVGYNKGENPYYLFRLEWGPRQYIYRFDLVIMSKYFSFLYYLYRKLFLTGYTQLWKNKDVYKDK